MSQFDEMFERYSQSVKRIAPLTDADCEMFIPFLKVKPIAKGDTFIAEGQVSKEIGYINKGLFRMYYLQDGKEINTNFFLKTSLW